MNRVSRTVVVIPEKSITDLLVDLSVVGVP